MRLRAGLALVAACVALGCTLEVEVDPDADAGDAVQRMLTESAGAWNRGELAGFMDDYLQSPSTTYIGATGLLVGYDAIHDRFSSHFEPGVRRDSLRFEDVRVRRLAAIEAIATARWVLFGGDSITGSGPFTLVLRHTSVGWKIIHDHSSSDPAPPPPDESPS